MRTVIQEKNEVVRMREVVRPLRVLLRWVVRPCRRLLLSVLCALLEGPKLYKYNEQTGRSEEFRPRDQLPPGPPPRIF